MDSGNAGKLANTIRFDERLRERRAEQASTTDETLAPIGPGSKLGPYLVRELIGEGGMGLVYRATDTSLDRMVALKILPPYLTRNTELLQRIRTEAQAQARLHHPNIVTLYSVLEVSAGFILVMEYIQGETLRERIHRGGPLSPADAAQIFAQAIDGISYAHEKGIIHRDLKPDNIFITNDGRVKIMDFGVAKIVDNHEVTRTRSMVGTLLYIAPEQINGRDADFRSDIYTLGIGLFEAVTGRLPFERRSDYALMHAHMLEAPPRPSGLRGNLPAELESVILRAIEKEPEKRFQSMREFRSALLSQSDLYGLGSSESESGRTWLRMLPRLWNRMRHRNPVLGSLLLDVGLVLAAFALVAILGIYPAREPPVDDVEPVTHLTRGAPRNPDNASSNGDPAESVSNNKRPQSRDRRYDNLRKAWGG